MNKKKTYFLMIMLLWIIIAGCSRQEESYQADLEQLMSLPYITWTEDEIDASVAGVTRYNADKAYPGYNLFVNKENTVYLMDMNGAIVHTWALPFTERGMWEYAVLKENGNIVAECVDCPGAGAMEMNWNSEPVWESELKYHHDIEILPDGSFLIPDRISTEYKSRIVNFDRIIHVSKTGEVIDMWSTLDEFEKLKKYHEPLYLDEEPDEADPATIKETSYDYYHLNTIKVLPFTWAGFFDRRFQKGNWLICLRNANLICILDKDTKKVVWHWGPGELEWPHMPVMLKNGDILIFDNGVGREYTRIVQVNPRSGKITWEYKTDPPALFYSFLCGSAQRFPNGNTLVTNSDHGHVFEVTKKGETVWEFYHFETEENRRKTIYRMIKYPELVVKSLLEKYKTEPGNETSGK
ncbi:MAG: aryl-sulfate sulfotransferase [Spirochaetales bacterium]|nr:aryl-sulfate sulfotransferase [Spirochaetales bacterium]